MDLSLAGEDCQHPVTDESLCPVTGCALGTDVCHWMFKTKVNMVQGQDDGPLRGFIVHGLQLKFEEVFTVCTKRTARVLTALLTVLPRNCVPVSVSN